MNLLRMLLFVAVVLSIIALMEWFLIKNVRKWIQQTRAKNPTLWNRIFLVILGFGNVLILLRFVFNRVGGYDHHIVRYITYAAGLFALSVLLAFLLVFSAKMIRLLMNGLQKLKEAVAPPGIAKNDTGFDPRRREFLKFSGYALAGASVGAPIIGAMSTRREYQVQRIPLYFDSFPSRLNGLTIAQVSDIHSGAFMSEKQIREIFDIVNSLKPDMIVLTGDFIDSSDAEIPAIYNAVGMLRAELGVYGCLGNHDHFGSAEKVDSALRQRGIQTLNNSHHTLRIEGEALTIGGIDDAGVGMAHYADMNKTVEGMEKESFKILLSHRPTIFKAARDYGFDLTLSGHTHGGQIGGSIFGVEVNPISFFMRYVSGLYVEEGKQLYVNVGVGMAGVPIRLVPREISLFTLHHKT